MSTAGMNLPTSAQRTPSRERNPTYRSDIASSQTASPSSLRVAHSSSSTSPAPAASVPVTVQQLLQQHASSSNPAMAALDVAVQERNTLSGQNAQLWKLIEKQRTGYAQLMKEIERVRGERDAYRGRLQGMGENTDTLLRAHRENQRREGKEGSLRSAASSSHLKNSESTSSTGHASGGPDPRTFMLRSQSDDIPPSQRAQGSDSSWPSRANGRERQGSQASVHTTASTSQLSNSHLSATQTSSSAQLSASSSDNGTSPSTSSPSNSPMPKQSQDPRKPPSLAISPARSASLPSAAANQQANSAVSAATSVSDATITSSSSRAFSVSDVQNPNSVPPSAAILLTPATPAAHSGSNSVVGSFASSSTSHPSLHPQVIVQSASVPSFENSSAKPASVSMSYSDLPLPNRHDLSRDSHISLPEETKRYYASLVDSPAPSPQFSSGFPTMRGDSPDKLSPVVPQRRSESPLKPVQVAADTAAEQLSGDRRAINHSVDNSEFLDLDADDTDTTSPYDSVDDSGRVSAVDSFDRPDDVNGQLEGLNGSRKDKKRAVVEDFPLPPNTPPVVQPGNDGVFAAHQADMSTLSHANYSSRTHTSSSDTGRVGQASDARSMSSSHHDLSDSRTPASQSQVSLPPSYMPAQDDPPSTSTNVTKAPTFRSLPLLPTDLPHTTIQVAHSSIRPNDRGKDVLSFIITVDPGNGKECWNIEKLYSDVLTLDARIRASIGKSMGKKLVSLPEGRLWRDHAPARVDQRKVALELYLRSLIALPVKNKDEIIAFFTSGIASDAQKPVARAGYKEGYLTKRGKNFGGWKTRYFVLQGPSLEYYESRGGTHLGSIAITGAQIGRQQRTSDKKESEEDNEYRHAFLIIEAKRGPGGAHPRHVLCAESDAERDHWVELLVRYVTGRYSDEDVVHVADEKGRASISSSSDATHTSNPRPLKEDITKGGAVPISQLTPDASNTKLFQGAPMSEENAPSPVRTHPPAYPNPSGSANTPTVSSLPSSSPLVGDADSEVLVSVGQRANSELGHYPDLVDQRAAFKAKPTSPDQKRKENRRSIIPLKTASIPERSSSPDKDAALTTPRADQSSKVKISGPIGGTPLPAGFKFGKDTPPEQPTPPSDRREKAKSRMFWGFGGRHNAEHKPSAPVHVPRAVFGTSLEESLQVAEIASLPAIVFRCIQYLEAKKADQEEGIYRLSGSSAVIKALKDRFNNEGDVDLLGSDEHWDPHAISGLLKTFLRELPASILTRDLHLRFLSVIDFVDPQERITELSQLIAALPIANYSLLRALTAHLISVVQNAHVNKMTMRNVGIVFSPTLGIPAGVFSLMLGEFKRVFNVDGELDEGQPAAGEAAETESVPMNRRNSKRYSDAAADELLGLSGRALTTSADTQSDEGEDFSLHDESGTEGADMTENESIVESSATHGSALNGHLHPSDDASNRSRISSVAASRGLNISVTDKATRRQSRMVGLPHSPRPHHASPHSPHTPQKINSSPSPSLIPPPSPLHTPR